jgi:hypothetical protein
MFTADLVNLFKSHCGGCHVDAKLGGFQATARTFGTTVDAKAIATIKAEDPAKFMPPLAAGGKPYSKRAPGDPLVELVTLLEQWTAQNRPADAFKLAQPEAGEAGSPFLLTEAVGKRMTNLGDCVMEPGPLPGEGSKMADLDAFFAKATELPVARAGRGGRGARGRDPRNGGAPRGRAAHLASAAAARRTGAIPRGSAGGSRWSRARRGSAASPGCRASSSRAAPR